MSGCEATEFHMMNIGMKKKAVELILDELFYLNLYLRDTVTATGC